MKPLKMAERLLVATYIDHSMDWEWEVGGDFTPFLCTVVGYELPSDDPRFMHLAAERKGEDWRAVTHLFVPAVIDVRELVPKEEP